MSIKTSIKPKSTDPETDRLSPQPRIVNPSGLQPHHVNDTIVPHKNVRQPRFLGTTVPFLDALKETIKREIYPFVYAHRKART